MLVVDFETCFEIPCQHIYVEEPNRILLPLLRHHLLQLVSILPILSLPLPGTEMYSHTSIVSRNPNELI